MYIVAKYFTDLQDNDHPYQVGETFPREGLEVSEGRFKELASTDNKQGVVLIKAVKDGAAEVPAGAVSEEEQAAVPKAKTKGKGKASGK